MDCVQGAENKQRLIALEAEVRQNHELHCKELDRVNTITEKRYDEIWKAIDDLRSRLIFRPTWSVLTIVSLLTGISSACIIYIVTH